MRLSTASEELVAVVIRELAGFGFGDGEPDAENIAEEFFGNHGLAHGIRDRSLSYAVLK